MKIKIPIGKICLFSIMITILSSIWFFEYHEILGKLLMSEAVVLFYAAIIDKSKTDNQ